MIGGRIQQYSDSEIRFNLMAMVGDRRVEAKAKIAELEARQSAEVDEMEGAVIEEQKQDLLATIADEERKRAKWAVENVRRRHNFIPLCIELLKVLAKSGQLDKVIDGAKEKKANAPVTSDFEK